MSSLFDRGPDYAKLAGENEQRRMQAINEGTGRLNQIFSQFSPDFYKQREQAYYQYAMPQLAQQYQSARNAMMYGMSNRGLTGGSAAGKASQDLAQSMGENTRSVADAGRAQAQELQQQIEAARNQLMGQLYQSADPGGVGNSAVSTAAQFARPSMFQPLGNMFGSLANQYSMNQALSGFSQGSPVYQSPNNQSFSWLASTPVSYGGTNR